MSVTLTSSNTAGFVDLAFPDESGGMVGAQSFIGIPQYNMTIKYDPNVYSDQAVLADTQKTVMDDSVDYLDGDIVLKFKNFLVEEMENDIFLMVSRTSSMHLLIPLMRDMSQTGEICY